MKQVFWFLCASIVPALIGGSLRLRRGPNSKSNAGSFYRSTHFKPRSSFQRL